jgi:hypothetical protein
VTKQITLRISRKLFNSLVQYQKHREMTTGLGVTRQKAGEELLERGFKNWEKAASKRRKKS